MGDDEHRKPTTKLEKVVVPEPRRPPSVEIDAVDEALVNSEREGPETSDRCPVCEGCALCRGTGMVTATQKKAFARVTQVPTEEHDDG